MSDVTFLLKGHSGPPVSDITFLLKGHSGPPVSDVTFLNQRVIRHSELSAAGAKRGVRSVQLPDWSLPDDPFYNIGLEVCE